MKKIIRLCAALSAAFFLPAAALAAMSDAEFIELCRAGAPAAIEQALADGANPNAETGEGGQTPLMIAAGTNADVGAVVALLAAGADLNARDDANMTPLMHAAGNAVVMVQALLNAGAPVNDQDGDVGETALMVAARVGRAGIVAVLLDSGADKVLIDAEGHDALWHARQSESEDRAAVIRLLQGEAEEAPDALRLCLDRTASAEMPAQAAQDCHAESRAHWNRQLNANYRKAREICAAAADPDPCRWRLQEAERLWLRYRDAMREAFAHVSPADGPEEAQPHGFEQRATKNQAGELELFARQGEELGKRNQAAPPPDGEEAKPSPEEAEKRE